MAERRIISNPVYESIQPSSLGEDPKANSVILYANRYSPIGEVPISDEELISVLNSTVGAAGNNVLVQLKKKMTSFRNGPWYIDSRDGMVYIHNRKFSSDTVYDYVYQHENGELLQASFRMVEVFKPLAGIASAINGITKAITHQVQQMLDFQQDYDEPLYTSRWPHLSKEVIESVRKPFKGPYYSIYQDAIEKQLDKLESEYAFQEDRVKVYNEYNSKSAAEKNKEAKDYAEAAYAVSDKEAMLKLVLNKSPQALTAWNNYKNLLAYYSAKGDINNPAVKQAYQEVEQEFRKVGGIPTANSARRYGSYRKDIYTKMVIKTINPSTGKPYPGDFESRKEKAVNEAVENWRKNNRRARYLMGDVKIINVSWKLVDTTTTSPAGPVAVVVRNERYQGRVRIQFEGYEEAGNYVSADRILHDLTDRYSGSKYNDRGGNSIGMISNAMSNLGRGKKEKKLQASIRVIGNPILECMQQINLQNVGKSNSGVWYITTISHSIEHGQGYVCDIELSRQLPKNGSTGTLSEVHTQQYTVDNEEASVNNQTPRGRGTTSTKPRSKANVVKTNSEYTYQDALDEPLTSAEAAYVQARASTARSNEEASKIISEEIHNIARHRIDQKAKGGNTPYAKVSGYDANGNPVVERTGNVVLRTQVNKPNKKYTSENYDRCINAYLRGK